MHTEINDDSSEKMNQEEWLARAEAVNDLAWSDAQKAVMEMTLPAALVLPREISGLHFRANAQYTRTYDKLQDEFGEKLPALFAYAQCVKWVSCWDGAYWYKHSIDHRVILDNDYSRASCTAEGYAHKEGWSYTVFNKQWEFRYQPFFQTESEKFGLEKKPNDQTVLTALELHWLWLASDSNPTQEEFLEYLHEASEAETLSNGLYMWDEGAKCSLEEMESDPNSKAALSARRLLAKTAAKARHAPSQAVREKVVARYKAEKEKFSSKDSAAIAFTKDFPFEFSTIRDWLKGV